MPVIWSWEDTARASQPEISLIYIQMTWKMLTAQTKSQTEATYLRYAVRNNILVNVF